MDSLDATTSVVCYVGCDGRAQISVMIAVTVCVACAHARWRWSHRRCA